MTRKTILLAEDNIQHQDLMREALRRVNPAVRVDVVRDGRQALDYLLRESPSARRNGHALPAVVLLGMQLPRLSGLEVLERLRADRRTATLPVVMLADAAGEGDRLESYRRGCNSFVHKPADATAFTETMMHLGAYWLARNEPPGRF